MRERGTKARRIARAFLVLLLILGLLNAPLEVFAEGFVTIEPMSARGVASGLVQFELRPTSWPTNVTEAQARAALMNVTTVTHSLFANATTTDVATSVNGAFARAALYLGETTNRFQVYIAGFQGWVDREGITGSASTPIGTIGFRAIAVYYPFGNYTAGLGRSGGVQGYTSPAVAQDIRLLEFADQTVEYIPAAVGFGGNFTESGSFVQISPMNISTVNVRSVPYYVNRNGNLHRILTGNVTTTLPAAPWGHLVGPAPSWMPQNVAHYSFDGVFFYRNPRNIRTNGAGAVNANNPHFNYFQYLSFRARSQVTAAELNSFISAQLNAEQRGRSVMMNTGQHFINAQNTFGTNALLQFAKGIHESNRGLSNIAINNNNIFGLNAVDANPGGNANVFPNVQASINDHANGWMSRGYLYPRDWRHAGPHVGHKGSGMNVRYATDPYWGEKIAGWAFRISQASGLRDFNRERIAIRQNANAVNVTNAAGNILYTANARNNLRFYPFLLIGGNATRWQVQTSGSVLGNAVQRNAVYNHSVSQGFIPGGNLWFIGAATPQRPPQPPPVPPAQGANVLYSSHVQNIGWMGTVRNGAMSGTTGRSLRVEALRIQVSSLISGGVEYRTHIQDIGWQAWRRNGEISGTTGQSRRVEAVEVRLTGELATRFDIWYRVHVQNFGWLGWARNGASAGSAGRSLRIEAIEVRLVPRGGAAPGNINTPFLAPVQQRPPTPGTGTPTPQTAITYNSHLRDIGWQGNRSNGAMSGTTGQSRRIEAIRIHIANPPVTGGVRYQVHIQGRGWSPWAANGATAGTTGQGRQIEGIRIELTGALANRFHVEYRVHQANHGWLGWVRNGATAGWSLQGLRLEAIEIRLIRR